MKHILFCKLCVTDIYTCLFNYNMLCKSDLAEEYCHKSPIHFFKFFATDTLFDSRCLQKSVYNVELCQNISVTVMTAEEKY